MRSPPSSQVDSPSSSPVERHRVSRTPGATVHQSCEKKVRRRAVGNCGAGPRAAQQRDRILQTFADVVDAENAAAARRGLIGRFESPLDTFAAVGAVSELVSRQVRLGEPEDVLDLAPVIDRLIFGLLPDAPA